MAAGLLAVAIIAVAGCSAGFGEDPASAAKGSKHHRSHKGSSHKRKSIDLTHLKVGDGKVTTTGPKRGYVYSCGGIGGVSGATASGSWISGSHWDYTSKPTVDGSVNWPDAWLDVSRSGAYRTIEGDGLPTHPTGIFPIATSDDAYRYDRNPNSISPHSLDVTIPANPTKAAHASCVPMGEIGVLDSGAALFNALDAGGNDAAAHEIQDSCDGHPNAPGQYHYHDLPSCIDTGKKTRHSKRIGWALDGFPIYGPRGKHGTYMTNSKLDACHGHTHKIRINGKRVRMYHYHATQQYPYTISCYRGTPVRVAP